MPPVTWMSTVAHIYFPYLWDCREISGHNKKNCCSNLMDPSSNKMHTSWQIYKQSRWQNLVWKTGVLVASLHELSPYFMELHNKWIISRNYVKDECCDYSLKTVETIANWVRQLQFCITKKCVKKDQMHWFFIKKSLPPTRAPHSTRTYPMMELSLKLAVQFTNIVSFSLSENPKTPSTAISLSWHKKHISCIIAFVSWLWWWV